MVEDGEFNEDEKVRSSSGDRSWCVACTHFFWNNRPMPQWSFFHTCVWLWLISALSCVCRKALGSTRCTLCASVWLPPLSFSISLHNAQRKSLKMPVFKTKPKRNKISKFGTYYHALTNDSTLTNDSMHMFRRIWSVIISNFRTLSHSWNSLVVIVNSVVVDMVDIYNILYIISDLHSSSDIGFKVLKIKKISEI